MKHLTFVSTALALAFALACTEPPAAPPSQLAITVNALSLTGVGDVRYTLRAKNGATPPALVWEQTGLLSSRFGDGKGGLAYIAPCDASPPPIDQHTIELVIEALYDQNDVELPTTAWYNPAPASRPLVQTATCRANADTPIVFNLTVLRSAQQGFFDVAVTFEDVFCSAKLDCVDDDGGPLTLLHDPATGERARTIVVGFACTSGAGSPTWLHYTDLSITCGSGPTQRTFRIDPARVTAGNAGPAAPVFFQTAVYRGDESLPGVDKCYWNLALGITEGALAADCRLVASATASSSAFTSGATPDNTIWPMVHFDVPLTDADGDVTCGAHPMNGTPLGVSTRYTDFGGEPVAHSWQCGTALTATAANACAGTLPSAPYGPATTATFASNPTGVSVTFGNSSSPSYQLPEGLQLATDCCMNPCCATP